MKCDCFTPKQIGKGTRFIPSFCFLYLQKQKKSSYACKVFETFFGTAKSTRLPTVMLSLFTYGLLLQCGKYGMVLSLRSANRQTHLPPSFPGRRLERPRGMGVHL